MSLETGIIALAEAIGTDVKTLTLMIGDLSKLPTHNKNNLVDAIKEALTASGGGAGDVSLALKIGDLSQLPTRNKNNLVDAINEIISDIGSIATIDDTAGLNKTKVTWSANKSTKELAKKVDKVAGYSLVGDDEIVKLLTVEQDAQKNTVSSVAGRQGDVLLNKEDVGLSSVDNTSDINKPISNPTQTALDNKVEKQAGKELSDTNFTQAEKDKLSSLESSKFVGLFVSESALPATGSDGDYANVDGGAGDDIYRVIWVSSDNKWVRVQGVSTEITDAQIKQQYESNPDTNPFKDDEKDKLSGIAVEATKNRDDSENADKIHSHNINDVTGLSERLSDIDALRSDLENPDKGAAMVARSVLAVVSVADLVALPAMHRRDDLRYLVKERVAGSGVGGGEFIWDELSTEGSNGGTVFSPDERMPGRFVRLFEGALRSYWFLEGDKSDLGYVQKALNFTYTSGRDIELEHNEIFNTATPFVVGPASGNYKGTISGFLKINAGPGFPPEATLLTIRKCSGEISAKVYANGFDRCRVAIEYHETGRLALSGDVEGRRATMWGHLIDSIFGNSNSMRWLGELRGTLCGSNYTQDFQHLSSNIQSSTIKTPEISEIGMQSIVSINEKWYHIESSNPEETVIQPSLPMEDRIGGVMQIFVGGGCLVRGKDAGVGLISKMVTQANRGVGMRSGSLYGNIVNAFVGEMNEGPSIVVGSSTTAANLKNVFLDSYFEGGPRHRVVVASVNGQISMPAHFNLGSDGVYTPPRAAEGAGAINVPRLPSAYNASMYDTSSIVEATRTVYLGGYYFFRSHVSSTHSYNIVLTTSSGEVAGGATIILYNFPTRPVIFTCSKGQNINGMPSLTLNSPGTIGITAVKTRDGWALSSFETTILGGI